MLIKKMVSILDKKISYDTLHFGSVLFPAGKQPSLYCASCSLQSPAKKIRRIP